MNLKISLVRFRVPSVIFGIVAFGAIFTASLAFDFTPDDERGAARAIGFAPQTWSPADVERLLAREGFREIGQTQRRGNLFIVQATAPDGIPKTVVVTANDGLRVGDGPIADRRGVATREPVTAEE